MERLGSKRMHSFLGASIIAILSVTPLNGSMVIRMNVRDGQNDRERVEEAADMFIKRFRGTLDFGTAFEEASVPDAFERLQNTEELQSIGISEDFASKIDTQSARKLYYAFMNFYYLNLTYVAGSQNLSEADEPRLPTRIKTAINRSHYLKPVLMPNRYALKDPPKAANMSELRQYIRELEHIASLYRPYLRGKVFQSTTYRKNIAKLERERGHRFEIMKGNSYFQVPEDTNVYLACRDVFCLYFIELKGEMKIVGTTIGD